jgi:hypothetical protein
VKPRVWGGRLLMRPSYCSPMPLGAACPPSQTPPHLHRGVGGLGRADPPGGFYQLL